MRTWLALILAPSLALAAQSIMLSLVSPSCQEQSRASIHGVALAAFVIAVILAVLAFGDWQSRAAESGESPDHDSDSPGSTRRFLAIVATGVATISAATILAMWFGVWVLWPCGQMH
jgi:hypothetical protein